LLHQLDTNQINRLTPSPACPNGEPIRPVCWRWTPIPPVEASRVVSALPFSASLKQTSTNVTLILSLNIQIAVDTHLGNMQRDTNRIKSIHPLGERNIWPANTAEMIASVALNVLARSIVQLQAGRMFLLRKMLQRNQKIFFAQAESIVKWKQQREKEEEAKHCAISARYPLLDVSTQVGSIDPSASSTPPGSIRPSALL
jgi:hypothetical protein